jgi:hypothetical protein
MDDDVPPRKRRVNPEQRRALQLLACSPFGATVEALVLGHGFKLKMLDDLVRAKLAKRYRVTITADGQTTGVEADDKEEAGNIPFQSNAPPSHVRNP